MSDKIIGNNFYISMTQNGNEVLDRYGGDDVDVTIPESISIIGRRAFTGLNHKTAKLFVDNNGEIHTKDSTPLRSVRIPSKVGIIADVAFEDCIDLEEIYFDNEFIIPLGECFDNCHPKIIKIDNKDVGYENLDFLKSLKACGMSLKNLESCSDEIKLLIEAGEL